MNAIDDRLRLFPFSCSVGRDSVVVVVIHVGNWKLSVSRYVDVGGTRRQWRIVPTLCTAAVNTTDEKYTLPKWQKIVVKKDRNLE